MFLNIMSMRSTRCHFLLTLNKLHTQLVLEFSLLTLSKQTPTRYILIFVFVYVYFVSIFTVTKTLRSYMFLTPFMLIQTAAKVCKFV